MSIVSSAAVSSPELFTTTEPSGAGSVPNVAADGMMTRNRPSTGAPFVISSHTQLSCSPKREVSGPRLGRRRKILLCYDFSHDGDRLLQWVFTSLLVSQRDHVVLLTVETPNKSDVSIFNISEEVQRAAAENRSRQIQVVHETLAAIFTRKDITFQRFVLQASESNVSKSIVDLAERIKCNMIVLGSSGKNMLRRIFQPSVASSVLSAVSIPVLVVKQKPEGQSPGKIDDTTRASPSKEALGLRRSSNVVSATEKAAGSGHSNKNIAVPNSMISVLGMNSSSCDPNSCAACESQDSSTPSLIAAVDWLSVKNSIMTDLPRAEPNALSY